MKTSDYITILAPMVSELKLSGNNLIIFALIHGFSKDGIHKFEGSIDYICKWTNLSRPTVISCLKTLTECGVLNKTEFTENNIKRCHYTTNYDELIGGSKEILLPVKKINRGGKETLPNIDNNNGKDKSLPYNDEVNKINNWREDFLAYIAIVDEAKVMLLSDLSFKADKEKYYPNIDYKLTIEKMVKEYWGTEIGWNKRKKSKTKNLNMVLTLKKGFDYATNRVYKSKQSIRYDIPQSNYSVREQDNRRLLRIKVKCEIDGELRLVDGTTFKNNHRYYVARDCEEYSIPVDAPERPDDRWEYRQGEGWYLPYDLETADDIIW